MSTGPTLELRHTDVPRQGLPLGWRLALYTATIVTLVMGSITVFQEQKNIRFARQQLTESMASSLLPLVARIEKASDLTEMVRDIQLFHEAYLAGGMTSHNVSLRETNGHEIATTLPNDRRTGDLFHAEVSVANDLFVDGTALLSVYQDETALKSHVRAIWIRGLIHFITTLAAILLALHFAIQSLVIAPLNRLLDGIRKTEMGYWGEVDNTSGAWEIKWIIWRFQNMGRELERTVEHLLSAQRRARLATATDRLLSPPATESETQGPPASSNATASRDSYDSKRSANLQSICAQLEAVETPSPEDLALSFAVTSRYALEAEEIGDMSLKSRLENASLRIMNPQNFRRIEERFTTYANDHYATLQQSRHQLQSALNKNMIPVVDLQARNKHIAGISAKMVAKGLDFEQIHDLFAFRVVVPSESDCYWALGVIHEVFAPVVGRFKDYIAHPKKNGYRSIHTCVRAGEGLVFEVQIRSLAMHRGAEDGAASHLNYKKRSTKARERSL